MIGLLIGYMWLFIHRPFEVWPALGAIRLELVYVISCIIYWLLCFPQKTWVSNRLNLAFSFFWAVFLLAWVASPFQDKCTKAVEDYFKYVVFYLLIMATVRDEKQLKALTLGYLVAVGLYMTHSFREFLCGRHEFRMGIVRMIGVDATFNDPNTFAATILYSLPITLALWPEAKNKKHRLLLLYYTALTVECIVLTGSRSGFVGLVCFSLFASRRIFRKKSLLLLMLGVVPLAWLVMPAGLQNRFWTLIDPSVGPANAQGSAEGRTQGLLDGITLCGRSPMLGFGPGAHGMAMGHGFQPHNLYGQTLGETGTLGAIAFLSILAGFVANHLEIRRLGRQDPAGRGQFPVNLSHAILISVALLLIKGYGDHNLYRYTWLWFGALQAIAVHCMRQRLAPTTAIPGELFPGPSRESVAG
jgi:O-antigen ligase